MQLDTEQNTLASAKKLLLAEAVLEGWSTKASGELSARTLAADAGITASSIYYYFSDMEHLYEAAQMHAIAEARLWCNAQIQALSTPREAGGLPVAALGTLLAAIIDDLCTEQRRIAFAWRECQLLAARQPRFSPLLEQWDVMFRKLCTAICNLADLDRAADLTYFFFEGESLFHLIRQNRIQDRAALEEMTAGWADWMEGKVPVRAPWRLHLWKQAQLQLPVDSAQVNDRIAKAAARLLVEHGVAGITHRAVAAEAGMTLGVVAHHCRRAADLLEQAYGAIYQELTGNRLEEASSNPPDPSLGIPSRRQMLGVEELVLAVARGRTDTAFAARLRYLRGTTSSSVVESRIGISGENAVLISTILSNTLIGLLRNVADDRREAALQSAEARLFGLLGNNCGSETRCD